MAINPFPRLNTRSQSLPSGYMPFTVAGNAIIPEPVVNADTAIKNSDIFSVISLISSQLASINYVMDEPFEGVFNHPNDKINSYGFWTSVINQMLLTGNAYVAIRRKKEIPVELEEIPYANVQVILGDNNGDLTYQVSYNDERNSEVIRSDDMLHFRIFVTGNSLYQYVGTSPLQALINELSFQSLSSRLSLNTLKNFIAPSLAISVPEAQLSKESKETIRDSFQEQYSGANQGKPVVLDQSATVEAMPTIDAKTAEYLNNVDWTRAQVSKVFGIPDNYLNGQGDQQSSLDQSTSMFISSFNRYIKPFVSELEQKFKVPVKADLDPIVDPTGSKYADMIAKFASGKAPVLSGEQVIALLQRKGVIDDDFEK